MHEDLLAKDAPNRRIAVPTLLLQGGNDDPIDASSTMDVQRNLRARGTDMTTLSYPPTSFRRGGL